VPELIASADLGVVPKRADGFGNEAFSTKILEFMACGVPVIVSRTKIDAYYFDNGTVTFFEPGDVSDLARQMRWAYEHPVELRQVAASATEYVRDYNWQKHAGQYLALVDGLAARSQASPGEGPDRNAGHRAPR